MTVKTLPTGERVIMDPTVTISRVFLYFYVSCATLNLPRNNRELTFNQMMVNVGSLTGSIAMVYAEKYVGFYLAFLLPTFMLCLCPMVVFACRNKYKLYPPTGSPWGKAFGTWGMALRKRYEYLIALL